MKKRLKFFLFNFALFGCACLSLASCDLSFDSDSSSNNKTQVVTDGTSAQVEAYKKYKDKEYEAVVEQLESQGFHNITVIRDGNLITGWVSTENTVREMSINGDSKFKAGSYDTNAEIIIHVHSYDGKCPAGHDLSKVTKKDATCQEYGIAFDAYYCSECDNYYTDSKGNGQLQKNDVLVSKHHNLSKVDYLDSTCTESGHIEHYYCSTCHHYFNDANASIQLSLDDISIAASHKHIVVDEATSYGVGHPGLTEGSHCEDCGKVLVEQKEVRFTFGSYPQSRVTDAEVLSQLSNYFNAVPWKKMYFYTGKRVDDTIVYENKTMNYKDIDIDGDGNYDYREIQIQEFQKFYTSLATNAKLTGFQYENGYSLNGYYVFKYEPIEWDILEEANGERYLISNLIIDSQEFYSAVEVEKFGHNSGDGFANNYELSHIRKWLNEDFYNTAFTQLEKELIINHEIDNSSISTGYETNIYSCDNTYDNVSVLSTYEANKYYETASSRKAIGTDYAKSQNLFVSSGQTQNINNGYSDWWLRSPSDSYLEGIQCLRAQFVLFDGIISGGDQVTTSAIGVRPVIRILL